MSSNAPTIAATAAPLLEARNLSRVDPSGQTVLLQPTDFVLSAGAQVAITGSSGSGKSVFLRLLAMLDQPATGQVCWQGNPVPNDKIPTFRSRICYLAQRPAMIEGNVLENLQFPFTLKSLSARTFNLDFARDLLAQAGKEASFLNRQASELSGGEAQIVALVRTLQLSPQVILLDEPTAALDAESATAVEDLVRHWFRAEAVCSPADVSGGLQRAYIWVSHDHQQARRMSTRHLTMTKGVLDTEARP